jgi:hypothetical protein
VRVFLHYIGVITGNEELGFVSAKDSSVADSFNNYLSSEIITATAALNYMPPKKTVTEVIICSNEFYFAGNDYRNSSGIFFDTIQTTNGYDSILITHLAVNMALDTLVDVTICEGESYFAEGYERILPGVYTDTFQTQQGCDSVVITNLEVFPNYETWSEVKLSVGNTFFAGGREQNQPGIYEDSYLSVHGCDSIVITYLEFDEANQFSLISDKNIDIFPVPTKGILNISTNALKSVELFDASGKKIITSESPQMELSEIENGLYYLVVITTDGTRTIRKVLVIK